MKYLIFGMLLVSIIILAGCSSTIVKYQCADGSFVDSTNLCSSKTCPETSCPKLDCSACPVKTETKIEAKTVTKTIYICSDGTTEVNDIINCPIEKYPLEISINSYSFTNEVSEIDQLAKNTLESGYHIIIIDLTLKNKNVEKADFGPNFITLKDEKGYQYKFDFLKTSDLNDGLKDDSLSINETSSGKIAFRIPKERKEFTITITNYIYDLLGETNFTIT